MPRVLISDKLSEAAVKVFKDHKIETSYMPGIEKDELLKIITEWVSRSHWVDFLSENIDTVSNTSICLKLIDSKIIKQPLEVKNNIEKYIITLLENESIAFDIGSYRSAPPGLRIWGGPTVENEDIKRLLPCLDWAYHKIIKKLKII